MTLESLNALMKDVRQGKGLVGRLLTDEKAANSVLGELSSASASLHRILATVEKGTETGEGLVTHGVPVRHPDDRLHGDTHLVRMVQHVPEPPACPSTVVVLTPGAG